MALKFVLLPILSLLLLLLSAANAEAAVGGRQLTNETLEWGVELEAQFQVEEESEEGEESLHRRSLYWHPTKRYYISYGALAANRVPCPPRSGRSYYTHNCFRARGPVHPYSRGCSAITRCRR